VPIVHRVHPERPVDSVGQYVALGGGAGLAAARAMSAEQIIGVISASGLRGRGGAGFPTGRKWRTVADMAATFLATAVVINAAEGEPGTFKDRALLRSNPYQVLEGALIAALAVQAVQINVVVKTSNDLERAILARAIDEIVEFDWNTGVAISITGGPDEYLLGEESALLEVVDGRDPFPRIAPPYRRGTTEVVQSADEVDSGSGLSAGVVMAGTGLAPPALVNNVETLANVPQILANGAAWFRSLGTAESPGTFLCTVTGAVQTEGVGEVAGGTTLADLIADVGGGVNPERSVKAVLCGVSNRVITADLLTLPIAYETMQTRGVGPGSAGFMVYDDTFDMIAVAAGVARFLAVESCGQCTPCKTDGVELADRLAALCRNEATMTDWEQIQRRLGTVAEGARCALASQQQSTVGSILEVFLHEATAHLERLMPAVEPMPMSELRELAGGQATWDSRHASKQPDWSYDVTWGGRSPTARNSDHRAGHTVVG
jgi:NADH:ubiquinone oxidoreductase subunit F (NADH-binding)